MIKKILLSLIVFMALLQGVFALTVEVVNTDPAPIIAGEYADITLRITNSGVDDSKLEDINIFFEKNSQFRDSFPQKQTLGVLYAREVYTTTFRVYVSEGVQQGNIILPVVLEHSGGKLRFDLNIFVLEDELKPQIYIGSIKTTPSELLPDSDNNKLTITLQNLGDKDAELISARLIWDSQYLKESYAYSTQDSVSSINGGEEAELEFTVDVEKGASGGLPATLQVNYRAEEAIGNSYETYTENIDMLIPITAVPFLVIENVEQLDSFNAGTTENRIRITIKNIGEEEAQDVRLRIQPDISYPFLYERTSEYVGASVKPGETATIEYKAEVTKDADARTYPTRLLMESMVQESRYVQDTEFNVEVQGEQQTSTMQIGILLLGLIVIVSAGFGVVRYVKRQNRKSK